MKKINYILLAGLPLFFSCSGANENDKKEIEVVDEAKSEEVVYNIPSPNEQFEIIANLDGTKNVQLVNDFNKANNYQDAKSKALNFGVYIADVSYLSSFKETTKYLSYFNKIEKLGSDLGVAQVFSEEIGDKAKKFEGNSDSLLALSDKTYTKTFQKLINIDKGAELSLMLAGGWIESMHLIIGTSKGFGKSPKIDAVLVDQKVIAENLIDFMITYQDNKDVSEYMDKIGGILAIYDGMDCADAQTDVKKDGNKVVLSGGNTCKMNAKTFDLLSNEVKKLRAEIVK